jgi:hypothetical protein
MDQMALVLAVDDTVKSLASNNLKVIKCLYLQTVHINNPLY